MSIKTIKEWVYRGCKLSINHVQIVPRSEAARMEALLSLADPPLDKIANGHHCGYVETTTHISEDAISMCDVHGGITFTDDKGDTIVYGFDCGHYNDTLVFWTVERVTDETQRLADEILAYEPEDDPA